MTKDEALKIALEALETPSLSRGDPRLKAIQACKEALAQPAQEPVALYKNGNVDWIKTPLDMGKPTPLYTHPAPSWQGLSDDEIDKIYFKTFDTWSSEVDVEFARAIEQALKEKNVGAT